MTKKFFIGKVRENKMMRNTAGFMKVLKKRSQKKNHRKNPAFDINSNRHVAHIDKLKKKRIQKNIIHLAFSLYHHDFEEGDNHFSLIHLLSIFPFLFFLRFLYSFLSFWSLEFSVSNIFLFSNLLVFFFLSPTFP